jgi:hypothetical protein
VIKVSQAGACPETERRVISVNKYSPTASVTGMGACLDHEMEMGGSEHMATQRAHHCANRSIARDGIRDRPAVQVQLDDLSTPNVLAQGGYSHNGSESVRTIRSCGDPSPTIREFPLRVLIHSEKKIAK